MTSSPVPINKQEQAAIKDMLASITFRNLMRVISGKMDAEMIEYANDALAAHGSDTNRSVSAEEHLKKAASYKVFLDVAKVAIEESKQPSLLSVIEIKPS